MRILLINDHYPPEGGGTAQVVKNLAGGFSKSGHDVLVLATCDGNMPQEILAPNIGKVRFLPIRYPLRLRSYLSLWNPKVFLFLQRALKEFKPDVILVHNIHSYFSYYALKILKQFGVPVVLTLHDVMTVAYAKAWPREKTCNTSWRITWLDNVKKARKQYNPFRSFFIQHYLQFPDRVLCVSDALRKVLAENGIKTEGVIHNGMNMQDEACGEKNKPPETKVISTILDRMQRENKKIILFGGRLSPAKGGKELMLATKHLLKRCNAVLVVAGEGPEKLHLQEFVNRYGLQGEVCFLGQVSEIEMHRLYSAAYCVVVPSISFDSFPTMNLEAMLHKKPVVATCFGGSKEAVVDGKTGYIVNPYDLSALRDAVENLIVRPEHARMMGEAGYQRLHDFFAIEKQIKEYLALI